MLINWGAGFYLGLKIGFLFIVIAIEVYFLLLDKFIEKELNLIEGIVLSLLGFLAFLLAILRASFFSIFILPSGYLILTGVERLREEKIDRDTEDEKLRKIKYSILKNPDNPELYVELGDWYFKREDYQQSIEYYKKAYSISEAPWIKQKIKIAEKEDKIKKGVIWICPECSFENPGEINECKHCGHKKELHKTIIEDIRDKEVIKYAILLPSLIIAIGIIFLLIKSLPLALSFIFVIGIIVIGLMKFFKW
ncbi:hypothetical protein J7L87_01290 [bacterium]|nr:hypothetical protein [bacterium]